jgi:predicted transcriptional regulator
MKKILSSSLLIATFAIALTGCLKDKGFDNHTYGINDPDTQPPGVGFPLGTGAKAKNDFGLDVTSTTQAVNGFVYVNLEAGTPAKSDIHITIASDTNVVNAYNAANGTSIQKLPAALWNVPTNLTIPAGSTNVQVPLNVTSTLTLNANLRYSVGLTIVAVDGGYTIAKNLKSLLIVFAVKNQYDGKYTLKGQFYHPSAAPGYPNFTTTVEMQTSGPNSVLMYSPAFADFLHPWASTNGGAATSAFGSQSPEYTINPITNKITVFNAFQGAVTSYSMGIGYTNAGYNSRWDPAAKTMYDCFGYNLAGQTFVPGSSRMWIDTLIRTGPR